MKRLVIAIFAIILVASCSVTHRVRYSQDKLDSYVGLTHQELVRRLGAPISDVSDGGDGYILVFEGNREIFEYSNRYAAKSSTLPKAQFYMNADGICYKARASNTDSVRVTSVGGTILVVLLILLLL